MSRVLKFAESLEDKTMTVDEVAALNMLSIQPQLYKALQAALRDRNRDKLTPFIPVFKLMLSGVYKLPLVKSNVYRGVRVYDACKTIREGKSFVWWGFSFALTQESDLQRDEFLGSTYDCSMIKIRALSAVDIKAFSMFKEDVDYVLLLPGTQVDVDKVIEEKNTWRVIQCHEEICPDFIDYPHPDYIKQSAHLPTTQLAPNPITGAMPLPPITVSQIKAQRASESEPSLPAPPKVFKPVDAPKPAAPVAQPRLSSSGPAQQRPSASGSVPLSLIAGLPSSIPTQQAPKPAPASIIAAAPQSQASANSAAKPPSQSAVASNPPAAAPTTASTGSVFDVARKLSGDALAPRKLSGDIGAGFVKPAPVEQPKKGWTRPPPPVVAVNENPQMASTRKPWESAPVKSLPDPVPVSQPRKQSIEPPRKVSIDPSLTKPAPPTPAAGIAVRRESSEPSIPRRESEPIISADDRTAGIYNFILTVPPGSFPPATVFYNVYTSTLHNEMEFIRRAILTEPMSVNKVFLAQIASRVNEMGIMSPFAAPGLTASFLAGVMTILSPSNQEQRLTTFFGLAGLPVPELDAIAHSAAVLIATRYRNQLNEMDPKSAMLFAHVSLSRGFEYLGSAPDNWQQPTASHLAIGARLGRSSRFLKGLSNTPLSVKGWTAENVLCHSAIVHRQRLYDAPGKWDFAKYGAMLLEDGVILSSVAQIDYYGSNIDVDWAELLKVPVPGLPPSSQQPVPVAADLGGGLIKRKVEQLQKLFDREMLPKLQYRLDRMDEPESVGSAPTVVAVKIPDTATPVPVAVVEPPTKGVEAAPLSPPPPPSSAILEPQFKAISAPVAIALVTEPPQVDSAPELPKSTVDVLKPAEVASVSLPPPVAIQAPPPVTVQAPQQSITLPPVPDEVHVAPPPPAVAASIVKAPPPTIVSQPERAPVLIESVPEILISPAPRPPKPSTAAPTPPVVPNNPEFDAAPAPHSNPHYIGRPEYDISIFTALKNKQCAVLSGIGGVGKSQIANEYAHTSQYQLVWHFEARTETELEASYRKLAKLIKIPGIDKLSPADIIKRVHARLCLENGEIRDWLLIYNNATTEEDFFALLQSELPKRSDKSRGHVIITSRNSEWKNLDIVEVLVFSEAEAVVYIKKMISGATTADCRELAKTIGYLPLSLNLAIEHILVTKKTIKAFIREYTNLAEARGFDVDTYGHSVGSITLLSVDDINSKLPAAKSLLHHMAVLAAVPIRKNVLKLLLDDIGGADDFSKSLVVAESFGLLTRINESGVMYSQMHDLVAEVLQTGHAHKLRLAWVKVFTKLFDKSVIFTAELRAVFEDMLAHIETVMASYLKEDARRTPEVYGGAFILFGTRLIELGVFFKALWFLEEGLEIQTIVLGKDNPLLGGILNDLATVYVTLAMDSKAIKMYQKAIRIKREALGSEHIGVATLLYAIGNAYNRQSDYAKALEKHTEALGIRRKQLGNDHSDVASSLVGLAQVHEGIGEFNRALERHAEALAIRRKLYGPEHALVAQSIAGIATVHDSLEDFPKALGMFEDALRIQRKVYGTDHADIVETCDNIAGVYDALHEAEKALAMFEQSLSMQRRLLGDDHVNVAKALFNISVLYEKYGNHAKALGYAKEAHSIWSRVLGEDDPMTVLASNQIADLEQ